jgi:release factor glutamine methyltransferase
MIKINPCNKKMNTVLKNIVAHTYKPLLVKYLSTARSYSYNGIKLNIPPEVFHPGFFFSTRLLLQWISKIDLNKKSFLELGCGSGLIAISAAKKGAVVTATDINPVAVAALETNSKKNNAAIEIIESDLFENIPKQVFDIIAINPPYYKKQPANAKDHAWCCGENGEYFSALFATLANYIHASTEIIMVLFDGCDMQMIDAFAAKNNFALKLQYSKKNILEQNFIFKIESIT